MEVFKAMDQLERAFDSELNLAEHSFPIDSMSLELKPYPNEHSCRLKDPSQYQRFRRRNNAAQHDGKRIDFIFGIKKVGSKFITEVQAMRYPMSIWTERAARQHCKDSDGISFEPGIKKSLEMEKDDRTMEDITYSDDLEVLDFSFNIKSGAIEENGIFRGHASIFGNLDSQNDIVHPGAFQRSLKTRTPKVLWHHDPYQPIAKSLTHEEDKRGLLVEAQLLINQNVPKADEVFALMRHGVIDSLSIGFSADPKKQKFEEINGRRIRHLMDITLWEYSPVTFAANARARITRVKSIRTPRELEEYLREEGRLSWQASRFIASHFDFEKLEAARDGQKIDSLWDGEKSDAEALSALAKELSQLRASINT